MRGVLLMMRDTVGRPMEILLVEDDLEDAGLTFDALRQGEVPCRVSLVRDGEEAMEFLLRRQRFRCAAFKTCSAAMMLVSIVRTGCSTISFTPTAAAR